MDKVQELFDSELRTIRFCADYDKYSKKEFEESKRCSYHIAMGAVTLAQYLGVDFETADKAYENFKTEMEKIEREDD